MARPDQAYDVVLDGIGLMLTRAGSMGYGARSYQSQSAGASLAQLGEAERGYGNQNPSVELPLVQLSAHQGYGDINFVADKRYWYSINADCRFDSGITSGPLIHEIVADMDDIIMGFFESNGELFVLGGRYCKQIADDGTVSIEKDFGKNKDVTGFCYFEGCVYVGMGFTEPMWKRDGAGVWTQSSDVYCGKLTVYNEFMWASRSVYQIAQVASGGLAMTDANWSSLYAIGDSTRAITEIVQLDGLAYIGKEDGLYALDETGNAIQLLPELQWVTDSKNCDGSRPWHGSIFVPHHSGLIRFQNGGDGGNMVVMVTPGKNLSQECPIHGHIRGMIGDSRWLYISMENNEGDCYIIAGRELEQGENSIEPMVWHPLVKLTRETCSSLHISNLWENPRLFFGRGDDIGYIILPRNGDNRQHDSRCDFALASTIYFPRRDAGDPTTYKVFKSIEVRGRNIHPNRYVNIYYRTDRHTWKYAGQVTSGARRIIALADGGVTCYNIQLRADIVMASSKTPMILDALVLRGSDRPDTSEIITMTVQCHDEGRLKNGVPDRRSGADIWSSLKALEVHPGAVVLKDRLGVEQYVIVVPPIERTETEFSKDHAPEDVAIVRMAMFDIDTSSEDYTTARWGDNVNAYSTWDGEHVYIEA